MPVTKSHKSSKYCMHCEIWEWFQKPTVHWWWDDSASCWTWLIHKGFLRTKETKQLTAVCTHSSCPFNLLCLYGHHPLQKQKKNGLFGGSYFTKYSFQGTVHSTHLPCKQFALFFLMFMFGTHKHLAHLTFP